ncbi:MAG: proton-translocating transhydrogenase family protein [Caulobacteraceae bacterium]
MEAVDPTVFRLAIFVLAIFVGYYVVWSVTPALHTPLMAVTNAISSVIIVGALLAAAAHGTQIDPYADIAVPVDPAQRAKLANALHGVWISKGAGAVAAGLASVNIFGGFLVTQRMLSMYRKKDKAK